ncbi:MAG TPA: hypothetical protein VML75_06630 [Kofleriaceae bacterium]|nr:hypothetical protein [Kofleriaceae bacterium]
MELTDLAGLTAEERESLQRELARLHSLHHVIQWGLAADPAWIVAAVIVQDEYCHDVILPWKRQLHLVFDTT